MSPVTIQPFTARPAHGPARTPARSTFGRSQWAALFAALLVVGLLAAAALTPTSSPPQRVGSPAASSQFGGRLAVSGQAQDVPPSRAPTR